MTVKIEIVDLDQTRYVHFSALRQTEEWKAVLAALPQLQIGQAVQIEFTDLTFSAKTFVSHLKLWLRKQHLPFRVMTRNRNGNAFIYVARTEEPREDRT